LTFLLDNFEKNNIFDFSYFTNNENIFSFVRFYGMLFTKMAVNFEIAVQ